MVRVCQNCYVAVLEPHPELFWWFKCPICAYSEFNLDLIHKNNWDAANANKMAKRDPGYSSSSPKPKSSSKKGPSV
jgi:hypothetical protein